MTSRPRPGTAARTEPARSALDRVRLDDPAVPLDLRAELAAARSLGARGWAVLAHRLRTRHGEIDLLLRGPRRALGIGRGPVLLAVEVKARRHAAAPERCLDPRQLERIRRAVTALAPSVRGIRAVRVDVVAVRPLGDPWPPALEIVRFEAAVPLTRILAAQSPSSRQLRSQGKPCR